ncbi:hypothetical protein ASPBRDRAFT_500082 [Aspergillus brasiliensis CBS 101740]|uniref:Uncharacterized protein n=1 Tax=Aspergillus brasiliensis (strain CBS 101740 / IMI 381727 / IBT 21946) TaxID=767769 RepID=A0A1L9UNT8_ASPBC|nr:hypothetical protein ASPBRDRAFT_500082 [Aspergillus brasiliensis CBS 101740]
MIFLLTACIYFFTTIFFLTSYRFNTLRYFVELVTAMLEGRRVPGGSTDGTKDTNLENNDGFSQGSFAQVIVRV